MRRMLFSTSLSISCPKVGYSYTWWRNRSESKVNVLSHCCLSHHHHHLCFSLTFLGLHLTKWPAMEYSLLLSRWHCPSLGMTMPAILLSMPKCESASLANTKRRMESFRHPILSCGRNCIRHKIDCFQICKGPVCCASVHVWDKEMPYPTHRCLHYGIKSALGNIIVSRDPLFRNDLIELFCAAC